MKQKRAFLLLGLILLAGAVLRGGYLVELMNDPAFRYPEVDALFHDYWARGLAFGQWDPPRGYADPAIRQSPYFRPPGYPYFLAAVYRIFGEGYVAPRVVQFAIGLMNAVWLFLIGRRMKGDRTGLIAAFMYVTYWGFVYFEGELHAVAPVIFFLLAGIYLLLRCMPDIRPTFILLAGLCFGLAVLFRPNILVCAVGVFVWLFLVVKRRPAAARNLLFVAGLVLAVSPATIRNYRVSGEWIPVSSNTGINFYIGNHEQATGLCVAEIPEMGPFGTCFDYPNILYAWSVKTGKALSHAKASSFILRSGLSYIAEHPGRSARLLARKFLLFWGPREVSHNKAIAFERGDSLVLKSLPLSFSMLLTLALGSLWIVYRRHEVNEGVPRLSPIHLLWILATCYCLSVIPFFVAARYRVPVIPLLILLGATVVDVGWQWYDKNTRKPLWRLLAVTAGIYILVSINYTGYEPSAYFWHLSRGLAYGKNGQWEEAEESFRSALGVNPDGMDALVNLGVIMERREMSIEARSCYEAAVYRTDHPVALYNLGQMAERDKAWEQAEYYYKRLLKINPRYPGLTRRIAGIMHRRKMHDAIQHPKEESAGHPAELH